MRRHLLLPLLAGALLLAGAASADTIRASKRGGAIAGTPRRDTLVGGKGADSIQAAFGGRDAVRCGAGRDVVSADLADRVSADCEVVGRRLSVDASANPASQHETAVEPDDLAWGSTVVAAFQLGRYERGAASNIGTAVSTDAGRTWRRAVLPGLTVESAPPGSWSAASDPTVAYDAAHGVWLVGALTVAQGTSAVAVSRSPDGLHWSAPVVVATGPILDKDWFACYDGAASPHRGRCYATYTDDAREQTVVQSSDDGGLTWSEPVRADATLVGTQPLLRPDGTLVIVAGDYQGAAGLNGSIVSLVSTDGGATFSRSTIAPLHAHPGGPLRAISLPSAAVDAAGTFEAAWHDCGLRPACTGNDLVLSSSGDGVTWSPPARMATGPGEAFLPGLGADPARPGHLGLVYATWLGACPAACRLAVRFVSSDDAGATWSAPQRLSTQPVEMSWLARSEGGRMVGDYFSTAYAGGRWIPVYALATSPLRGRLREAIFAASLPAAPRPGR